MPTPKSGMTRRISVTLPEKLVTRVEEYATAEERNDFIAEALEDYLEYLDQEATRETRQTERRERLEKWMTRLKDGSRRAANAFLPVATETPQQDNR